VQFCFLPNGEDPDSFLKNNNSENFREILKTSQNLADTLFQGYLEQYSISEKASAEDKTKFKKSLFDHIEKIADTDLKQFFRNDINNKIYEYFRISPNKTKFSNKNNGFLRTELLQSVKNIKKKYLAEKILLATLKNNPTLIERVYEPLMSMDGLPNDLLGFKNFLCEHTFADSKSLQAKAIELGFETVLQQLNTINLSAMASFGMTGADEDLAYKGWKDIWNHCYLKTELQNESTKMKMNLRQKLDDTSWAKWQQLKISIAIDTDEQEIQNTEIKTIRS
jgi:DNA primase